MKTLIITGGTGALGAVVTQQLIENSYKCVVPYRKESEAQALRNSISPDKRDQLLLLEANLLGDAEVERVVTTANDFGDFYGLVHLLGGIKSFDTIAETDIADFDFLMNINLRSMFVFSKHVMRILTEKEYGRIIGIASMQGLKPAATHGGYGVAKAGLIALTKILADEGREFGITANAIAPSVIRTAANLEWGSEEEAKTWVTPEEIAANILHLLSAEAASVNGNVLKVFGGVPE
jgi:NAD(P)-dependent dehydrogenase (short-subunit alcohol dehydrogenase family)